MSNELNFNETFNNFTPDGNFVKIKNELSLNIINNTNKKTNSEINRFDDEKINVININNNGENRFI